MYVTNWSDPWSDVQTWEVDGWFQITVSRREIIETTRPDVMYLTKMMPMVGLAMPVHDAPRVVTPTPLRQMLAKMYEMNKKEYRKETHADAPR